MTVRLRPIVESDLVELERFALDPEAGGDFEWSGFANPAFYRKRWEEDGWLGTDGSWLAVEHDGTFAGVMSWHDRTSGSAKQLVFEMGGALFPEHRGQGVGFEAHRQLVDYLFNNTPVHRIYASTETTNVAEQKTLEKCGFQREGVTRQHFIRGGAWRDSVVYSLLRHEWTTGG